MKPSEVDVDVPWTVDTMSQVCPYCHQGFQRLASHQWRCKQKPGVSPQPLSFATVQRQVASPGRPSNASSQVPTYQNFPVQYPAYQPQTEMKQRCPDCGGTYKDLSNHKICHKRGSGNYADRSPYVEMQVCPDCGNSFKNLANHKICHGKGNNSSRKSEDRSKWIAPSPWLTPPPSPRSYYEPPSAPWSPPPPPPPPPRPHHVYNVQQTPRLDTPPCSPQARYQSVYGESDDEEVRHRRRQRQHQPQQYHQRQQPSRHGMSAAHNAGLSDEEALAIALSASLDQQVQTTNEDALAIALSASQHQQAHRANEEALAMALSASLDQQQATNEEALAIALSASLHQREQTTRPSNTTPESDGDRAIEAQLTRCVDTSRVMRIDVDRDDIWKSSFPFFKKLKVSATTPQLMVLFTNSDETRREEAVDQGGPRREYLRLLCDAIVRDSGMLHGDTNTGLLIRPSNANYLKKNFRVLGIILATIIAQRGQPPAIFAPPLVDAILNEDDEPSLYHIPLKYVPQGDIRRSLFAVCDASNNDELEEVLSDCDWRFNLDDVPVRVTMDNRDDFVAMCVHYYVLLNSRPMLDQMVDGLKHCGILDLIRKHKLRHLLEYDSDVTMTSEKVMKLLVPRFTTRSNEEQQIVRNIRFFLDSAENGSLCETLQGCCSLSREQIAFAKSLKPECLLRFVTGCSREPAGGFSPPPAIVFQNSDTWRLPHVSTCSNELFITVHQRAITPNRLAEALMTAMMNSQNFTTA